MRLLDLYCGAGGCSEGYVRAGFEVVGVDIELQPHYRHPFFWGDALEALLDPNVQDFDAIHASPPCQAHTQMSSRWRGQGGPTDDHVDLIDQTRHLLEQACLPYVIENVPGARFKMREPLILSGGMFGLGVERPRLFETNWPMRVPSSVRVEDPIGVYGRFPDGRRLFNRKDGTIQYAAASLEQAQEAMGIDWMDWSELTQAIPPAYTELIGFQLLQYLNGVRLGSSSRE